MLDTTGAVPGMNNVLTHLDGRPTLAQAVGGTNDGRILAMHRILPGPSATMTTGMSRPDVFYALLDTTEFTMEIAGPLPGQEVFVGRPDLEGRVILGMPPFGLAAFVPAALMRDDTESFYPSCHALTRTARGYTASAPA